MKKIIIAPWSRKLPNVENNPKNYPWWQELIDALNNKYYIIQVSLKGEKILQNISELKLNSSLKDLKKLLLECDFFITVDSFFHHLATLVNKRGIVIYGYSDPKIFGNDMHINIIKGKQYLRKNQFGLWSEVEYNENVFVKPNVILKIINNEFSD
jgi:ADP-heptose:LPS heptosyltransferase